jgi:hypothetical protein
MVAREDTWAHHSTSDWGRPRHREPNATFYFCMNHQLSTEGQRELGTPRLCFDRAVCDELIVCLRTIRLRPLDVALVTPRYTCPVDSVDYVKTLKCVSGSFKQKP